VQQAVPSAIMPNVAAPPDHRHTSALAKPTGGLEGGEAGSSHATNTALLAPCSIMAQGTAPSHAPRLDGPGAEANAVAESASEAASPTYMPVEALPGDAAVAALTDSVPLFPLGAPGAAASPFRHAQPWHLLLGGAPPSSGSLPGSAESSLPGSPAAALGETLVRVTAGRPDGKRVPGYVEVTALVVMPLGAASGGATDADSLSDFERGTSSPAVSSPNTAATSPTAQNSSRAATSGGMAQQGALRGIAPSMGEVAAATSAMELVRCPRCHHNTIRFPNDDGLCASLISLSVLRWVVVKHTAVTHCEYGSAAFVVPCCPTTIHGMSRATIIIACHWSLQ
jgi:hypothetical protein